MKIKVSGNIANEISSNIPTYFIAINELLKNSYDADASNVSLILNTNDKTITIIDDGKGMSEDDIQDLLHISKSNKDYATIKENGRYVQGSKGLGFLAAFKFGKRVTWYTKNVDGNSKEFSIHIDDLITLEDIAEYEVEILDSPIANFGTTIVINLDDDPSRYSMILENFNDIKKRDKILHAFESNNMLINIEIDGSKYSTQNNIKIHNILTERQRFQAKFNTKDNIIRLYHNNHLALEKKFKKTANNFNIDMDIVFFNLRKGKKTDIPSLFRNEVDELTPLIYMNQNIFHNEKIFYPNIMQTIKYKYVMNQVLGKVSIYSTSKDLEFNSDRTNFVESPLTLDITNFLNDLNIQIQTYVAEASKYLVDLDFIKNNTIKLEDFSNLNQIAMSNIKDDFYFKDKVIINVNESNNEIVYTIFNQECKVKYEKVKSYHTPDNKNEKAIDKRRKIIDIEDDIDTKFDKAKLILSKKYDILNIPSEQINLYNYISEAKDSKGNNLDKNDIEIWIDDKKSQHIIESMLKPGTLNIIFKYMDIHSGLLAAEMTLEFKSRPLKGGKNTNYIISFPIKNGYQLNFNNTLHNLVEQINNLTLDSNLELVSCALRALFEICCDYIHKIDDNIFIQTDSQGNKLTDNKGNYIIIKSLDSRVKKLIEEVSKNSELKSQFSRNTKIDYDSLKNIFDSESPEKFKKIINDANLGAHKSTTYLKIHEVHDLAKYASEFLVITNEYINYWSK